MIMFLWSSQSCFQKLAKLCQGWQKSVHRKIVGTIAERNMCAISFEIFYLTQIQFWTDQTTLILIQLLCSTENLYNFFFRFYRFINDLILLPTLNNFKITKYLFENTVSTTTLLYPFDNV